MAWLNWFNGNKKIIAGRLEAGAHFEAVNSFARAVECFRAVLAIDPRHAEAHSRLGYILARLGQKEAAERETHIALQLQPRHAYVFLNAGQILSIHRKWDQAGAMYERAIALNPEWELAFCRLSHAYCMQKRYDDAEHAARRAIELDPQFVCAHVVLGHCLIENKCPWKEIKGEFKTALRLAPEDWSAHDGMARYFLCVQQLDEAEAHVREALRLSPQCASSLNRLALVLKQRGKWEEAEATVDMALHLDASHPGALSTKGGILSHKQQWLEARHIYDRLLAIDPDQPQEHACLARALMLLGRFEGAEAAIERALQLELGNAYFLYVKGFVLQNQQRWLEAGWMHERAIAALPDHASYPASYHAAQSFALYKQDRLAEAEAVARHALTLDAQCSRAWRSLGYVLMVRERTKEAYDAFLNALRHEPQEAIYLHAMGLYFWSIHNVEAALPYWHEALRLNPEFREVQSYLERALLAASVLA